MIVEYKHEHAYTYYNWRNIYSACVVASKISLKASQVKSQLALLYNDSTSHWIKQAEVGSAILYISYNSRICHCLKTITIDDLLNIKVWCSMRVVISIGVFLL